jgi:predicted tellurium resistance membrane protein TerC
MILGAAYLIWLMCDHFSEESREEAAGAAPEYVRPYSFGKTIALIALLDLSLSFDNVVAAVAFARDNIYLVYLGVTIGIITLRLVAGYCIKLLSRFPWLEHTAYILVGFVGALLCTELTWGLWIQREVNIGSFHVISGESGHYHIAKVVKFVGLIGIILVHIAYELLPWLRRPMIPILLVLRKVLVGIADSVSSVFSALVWPLKHLFKKAA